MKVFGNDRDGYVRVMEIGGKIMYCGSDVAKMVGYKRPNNAVHRHCKELVSMEVMQNGRMQVVVFVSREDVVRLMEKKNRRYGCVRTLSIILESTKMEDEMSAG